ncbi:MAG: terpene cyclase/mutase family protein [bacterium]|nr:terpene cyclase/mutase family protein [bacterium]
MKTKIFLAVFFALAAISLPNYASAGLPEAVVYLKSQAPDAWITQALIAAGETDAPTDHLTSVVESSSPTTDYAKVILALAAAGKNPTTFGDIDYVAKLEKYFENGQMGDANLLNDDIWSILALASIKKIGSVEATAAKNFLLSHQNENGGWGYAVGGASDTNDTAAAIMALIEMGLEPSDTVIISALDYLQSAQNDDGGFTYDPNSIFGTDSDSGSDAWVISSIYKVGQDPTSWIKNGNNPLAHMQSLQDNSDGGFWWITGESEYNTKAMTAFVAIALAGKSFPVGYFDIPQPTPTPEPTPAPASGGSGIFIPTYCQNVEYNIWQNTCADGWQYRNVLTITPVNCTLTVEQENQRKRACVAPEPEADENIELEPEVLGIKIASSSSEQLVGVAAEANEIISGQVSDFVTVGTDSTITLGAGERAGVLNSYKSTFGKLPKTQTEWEEVIRISNNQIPLTANPAAERKAKTEFKKVYGREADMGNLNDQAAINLMTYGLRPDKRDLDSERAGIGVFVKVYKYLPTSALDWDIIRAIAYSGIDR